MEQITESIGKSKGQHKVTPKSLANLKPFKKGQSGNPKGYPKGVPNYATARERAIRMLAKQNGKSPQEIDDEINANALLEARKGNFQFYKDDKDRTYGQATSKSDVNLKGDLSISIAESIANKHVNNTSRSTE